MFCGIVWNKFMSMLLFSLKILFALTSYLVFKLLLYSVLIVFDRLRLTKAERSLGAS